MSLTFEWDEAKNQRNIEKHKMSFRLASLIFNNENLFIKQDTRFDYGEDRYVAIGEIKAILTIITVVFTKRNQKIRIISARIASKKEKNSYYASIR